MSNQLHWPQIYTQQVISDLLVAFNLIADKYLLLYLTITETMQELQIHSHYSSKGEKKKLRLKKVVSNLWSQPAVAAILSSGRIEVPAIPGRSKQSSFLATQDPYL